MRQTTRYSGKVRDENRIRLSPPACRQGRKAIFLLFIVLSLTGCLATSRSTVKSADQPEGNGAASHSRSHKSASLVIPEQNAQATIAKKEERRALNLAVVPFVEKRGKLKNYGGVYKYLIPLVPYGTIRYERPDEAKMFNIQNEFEFNMNENLLEILITAARNSSLFGEVVLTPTPLASRVDLILSGEIHSTLYEGKTYSYGISFLGPALWCFGLPAGSSHKRLNIELYLKKIDTGEVVWSYNLNKEKTLVQGLYHNWGKDVNSFANLMQEGVKEAIASLRLRLSQMPFDNLKTTSQEAVVRLPIAAATSQEAVVRLPIAAATSQEAVVFLPIGKAKSAEPAPSAPKQPESVSSQIEPSSAAAFANTTEAITK